MIIRSALTDDYGTVGNLLVRAYAPSQMTPEAPYWAALRDTAGRAVDAEVWVAEVDGQVVGTVTWAGTGSGQREVSGEGEAEFRMLAVDPPAQGHGVGAALVQAVIERGEREGYQAVVLCSAEWMTSAHHLYETCGFHRVPDLDWTPVPGINLLGYRRLL